MKSLSPRARLPVRPKRIVAIPALALLVVVAAASDVAMADGPPRVVALLADPHADGASDIDRALRNALQSLDGIELAPQPALDLEAIQLAIDCVGETSACLRKVAERIGAQVLVAPTLKQHARSTELHLLYFDARDAERRFAGRVDASDGISRALLAGVKAMVRELFELREPPVVDGKSEPAPEATEPTRETQPATPADASGSDDVPTAAILIGGGGLLLVATGLVVGALTGSTEREYADARVVTAADAAAADDLRTRGEQQALAANLMLGVGAAVVAVAGVWLTVALGADERQGTRLEPALGPNHAGLRMEGSWGTP